MLAYAQDSELDRGATGAATATRTCALTREQLPAEALLRFVVAPAGEVVPDIKRKLPGRGLWVTATRAALEAAVTRKVFARGFKRDVRVAADLAAQAERLLERSALDALAIAGKSGNVVTGFSKVEAALAGGDTVALIHASDAAADGKRKLNAPLNHDPAQKSREIAVIEEFSGEQLDLALNRPNVVHAALLAGPVSGTFLARAARLARFRTGQSPDAISRHRAEGRRTRTEYGMSETKTPGEKKLSVGGGKLTLKPRTETGVVRQSFSHGRSKSVVVEKVKRRAVGAPAEPRIEAAPVEAPEESDAAGGEDGKPLLPPARCRSRPASCCAR